MNRPALETGKPVQMASLDWPTGFFFESGQLDICYPSYTLKTIYGIW